MRVNWNTSYVDPQNLISISRGDRLIIIKYLKQFQELIPDRIATLKIYLEQNERKMIRQTLHQMSPQLQFFGIPNVIVPIRRLEFEYETMSYKELKDLVDDILEKLEFAISEVNSILEKHFTR